MSRKKRPTKKSSIDASTEKAGGDGDVYSIDAIDKLKKSAAYKKICDALLELPGWSDAEDVWICMEIRTALAGPQPHERLTKGERIKTADKVVSLASELSTLLYKIHGSGEQGRDWPFEFRSLIDGMALSAAIGFRTSVGPPKESELGIALEDDNGAAFHAMRCGIYHALMDCMPETLEMLSSAAVMWKESDRQSLAKPNHKNANRLYFIRALTSHFVRAYGKPMRELTLDLTSVYFDCSDLDEAALSNLAPVTDRMKRLYQMDLALKKAKLS